MHSESRYRRPPHNRTIGQIDGLSNSYCTSGNQRENSADRNQPDRHDAQPTSDGLLHCSIRRFMPCGIPHAASDVTSIPDGPAATHAGGMVPVGGPNALKLDSQPGHPVKRSAPFREYDVSPVAPIPGARLSHPSEHV